LSVCTEASETLSTGVKNAIMIFFMTYGHVPCDKKCHSEHQTLFRLSERVWEQDYTGQKYLVVVPNVARVIQYHDYRYHRYQYLQYQHFILALCTIVDNHTTHVSPSLCHKQNTSKFAFNSIVHDAICVVALHGVTDTSLGTNNPSTDILSGVT